MELANTIIRRERMNAWRIGMLPIFVCEFVMIKIVERKRDGNWGDRIKGVRFRNGEVFLL